MTVAQDIVVAGIDVGSETTKVLLLGHGEVLARGIAPSGLDLKEAVQNALNEALAQATLARDALGTVISTGLGRRAVHFAKDDISEFTAAARGAIFLHPNARTVIDVGAEDARVTRCDASGRASTFATNDKCASGTGCFVRTMARTLELPLEEMGPLSLQSSAPVDMCATCVIFAETEVVSLIHTKTPQADIVRAIHDAIASRIAAIARRVGIEAEVILVGGVAKNVGFVASMEAALGTKVLVPEHPEFVTALGAALVAQEAAKARR